MAGKARMTSKMRARRAVRIFLSARRSFAPALSARSDQLNLQGAELLREQEPRHERRKGDDADGIALTRRHGQGHDGSEGAEHEAPACAPWVGAARPRVERWPEAQAEGRYDDGPFAVQSAEACS